MVRLILASQSPFRRELLCAAGYDVCAVPSGINEPELGSGTGLHAALMQIAEQKAQAVCRAGHTGLIFAADTVGHVKGNVFGKPRDREDARRMLAAISGTEHEVLTGWCLLRTRDGLLRQGTERTQIHMRSWLPAELKTYLDSGAWQGKSGAYGLCLEADPFVTRIVGSRSNVIGIPLERLAEVLAEIGESDNASR